MKGELSRDIILALRLSNLGIILVDLSDHSPEEEWSNAYLFAELDNTLHGLRTCAKYNRCGNWNLKGYLPPHTNPHAVKAPLLIDINLLAKFSAGLFDNCIL